jgi:hypothetical protein
MNLRNSGIFFIHVLQIDDETVDEEDNSVVAQTFLDRVCIALGTCPLPFRLSLSHYDFEILESPESRSFIFTLILIEWKTGGKTVVPIVFQHIPAMVQSNDWRHRFTALMTISLIGEGACNVLKPYLKSIVEYVFPCVCCNLLFCNQQKYRERERHIFFLAWCYCIDSLYPCSLILILVFDGLLSMQQVKCPLTSRYVISS